MLHGPLLCIERQFSPDVAAACSFQQAVRFGVRQRLPLDEAAHQLAIVFIRYRVSSGQRSILCEAPVGRERIEHLQLRGAAKDRLLDASGDSGS